MTGENIGEALYAWQVLDDGEWNIIGTVLPGGMDPMPLVTTRPHVYEKLQMFAEAHWRATGLPVRGVKFTEVVVLQEFES